MFENSPTPPTRLLRVSFYMTSGHVVVAKHVIKVVMSRDAQTGKYSSYNIEFEPGRIPDLFTLSVSDIIAVTTEVEYRRPDL
jgi:hypothetical protein